MRHLVLDLETVLDASLPPPPKNKNRSDVFPPAPYHTIVVMGAALLDDFSGALPVIHLPAG